MVKLELENAAGLTKLVMVGPGSTLVQFRQIYKVQRNFQNYDDYFHLYLVRDFHNFKTF